MNVKYSKEMLETVVKSCFSTAQVLTKLKLTPSGGNYKHIPSLIKKWNIDTSHFKGQSWNKGKIIGPKRPVTDYLINPATLAIGTHQLKLRLLKEGFFNHMCYNCNLTVWLGKPIPIELEHIDGNTRNNLISNLTLLCPNCHALTPTYRGKNKKYKKLGSGLPQDKS